MPTRPEAAMLHMQHAHVVALLVRRHEAARLKAGRDALAEARRTGRETAPATPRPVRKVRVREPRTA